MKVQAVFFACEHKKFHKILKENSSHKLNMFLAKH